MTAGPRVLMMPPPSESLKNPYVNLLAAGLTEAGVRVLPFRQGTLLRRQADMLHLHWPDGRLAEPTARAALRGVLRLLATLCAARALGLPVVWTAHNTRSHDRRYPGIERLLWAGITRLVSGVTTFSPAATDQVLRAHPRLARARRAVVPHGNYPSVLDRCPARADARRALGLPAETPVLLLFGLVRSYKRFVETAEVFAQSRDHEAVLVVAGEATDPSLVARLQALAAEHERVVLRLGRQDDDDVRLLLAAADTVLIPYADAMNSGALLLALSADRPVLASSSPTFAELRQECGPEWVRLVDGAWSPDTVSNLLTELAREVGPARCAAMRDRDWSGLGARTRAFYEEVLGTR